MKEKKFKTHLEEVFILHAVKDRKKKDSIFKKESHEEPMDEDFEIKIQRNSIAALLGSLQSNDANRISQSPETDSKKRKVDETGTTNDVLAKICDTGRMEPSKKGKLMFPVTCDVCDVVCNSFNTYEQHISGRSHMRKANMSKSGKASNDSVSDLVKALKASDDPVIGLEYISEIRPKTLSEGVEAAYRCELCNVSGIKNVMFPHIIGFRHRQKTISIKVGRVVADSKKAKTEASRLEQRENEKEQLESFPLLYSDEEYPWPPGFKRKPQLSENSSKDSQRSSNKTKKYQEDLHEIVSSLSSFSVKNEEDVRLFHSAIKTMLEKLIAYKSITVEDKHAKNVHSCGYSLLQSLGTIMNLPDKGPDNGPGSASESLFCRRESDILSSDFISVGTGSGTSSTDNSLLGSGSSASLPRNENFVLPKPCTASETLFSRRGWTSEDDWQKSMQNFDHNFQSSSRPSNDQRGSSLSKRLKMVAASKMKQ